jgi:transcription termination factor NusB
MGTRREARERAIQFLFQYDLNPPADLAVWPPELDGGKCNA